MNKIAFLLLFVFQIVVAQNVKRKLIWEENFNGKQLNETIWNFENGDGCPDLCGWGNNENQIYNQQNQYLKNGKLIIEATLENGIYKSSKITTQNKKSFQYGYIEIKAQLPLGKGLWPAFWMLGNNIKTVGWPKCGEIDILEYVGREPNVIFTSLHTDDSHGNTVNTKKTEIKSIEKGFHLYAIDWNKDKISFFIDNNLVYTFQPENKSESIWPYNQPFYFIINLAIGGNFGGPAVDTTIFPQKFEIDYIKVFK